MQTEQIITLACGIIGATGIGSLLVKWIISKISKVSEKIQAPMLVKFEEFLYSKLPDALLTTQEDYVKELKANGKWKENIESHDKYIEEATDITYKNLTSEFPKYVENWAKLLFPNTEKTIKNYIKNYYEKHKSLINKTPNTIIEE